jgi:hypothetical protein
MLSARLSFLHVQSLVWCVCAHVCEPYNVEAFVQRRGHESARTCQSNQSNAGLLWEALLFRERDMRVQRVVVRTLVKQRHWLERGKMSRARGATSWMGEMKRGSHSPCCSTASFFFSLTIHQTAILLYQEQHFKVQCFTFVIWASPTWLSCLSRL